MNLSPAADQPAPRTQGDPIAMRAAYTSGMVFSGTARVPTIDHRQYMERELDMHNAHQSFAVRQRVLQQDGEQRQHGDLVHRHHARACPRPASRWRRSR